MRERAGVLEKSLYGLRRLRRPRSRNKNKMKTKDDDETTDDAEIAGWGSCKKDERGLTAAR